MTAASLSNPAGSGQQQQAFAPLRVVLCGHSALAHGLLTGLLNMPTVVQVVGIVPWSLTEKNSTPPDTEEKAFQALYKAHNIPVIQVPCLNSDAFLQAMDQVKPDILLFGTWGEILKKATLAHLGDTLGIRVINTHPSLLPRHRGANPYSAVIANGERLSGVSFHEMVPAIDAGRLYGQFPVEITHTMTGGDLRTACAAVAELGIQQVMSVLANSPQFEPSPQNHDEHTYDPPMDIRDGWLIPNLPPLQVEHRVRAFQPWLDTFFFVPCPFEQRCMIKTKQLLLYQAAQPLENIPPGVILRHDGKIYISSADPSVVLVIPKYELYWFFGFLPTWLSPLWGRFILKPGLKLE